MIPLRQAMIFRSSNMNGSMNVNTLSSNGILSQ